MLTKCIRVINVISKDKKNQKNLSNMGFSVIIAWNLKSMIKLASFIKVIYQINSWNAISVKLNTKNAKPAKNYFVPNSLKETYLIHTPKSYVINVNNINKVHSEIIIFKAHQTPNITLINHLIPLTLNYKKKKFNRNFKIAKY